MATKTTILTLTELELAEAILNSCNGIILADVLENCVINKLNNEGISASTEEIVGALQSLVKKGQLCLNNIVLLGKKIYVRLEFVKI